MHLYLSKCVSESSLASCADRTGTFFPRRCGPEPLTSSPDLLGTTRRYGIVAFVSVTIGTAHVQNRRSMPFPVSLSLLPSHRTPGSTPRGPSTASCTVYVEAAKILYTSVLGHQGWSLDSPRLLNSYGVGHLAVSHAICFQQRRLVFVTQPGVSFVTNGMLHRCLHVRYRAYVHSFVLLQFCSIVRIVFTGAQ